VHPTDGLGGAVYGAKGVSHISGRRDSAENAEGTTAGAKTIKYIRQSTPLAERLKKFRYMFVPARLTNVQFCEIHMFYVMPKKE
jgi:hypothetical protein